MKKKKHKQSGFEHLCLLFLVFFFLLSAQALQAESRDDRSLDAVFKHKLATRHFIFYAVRDSKWPKYYADYLEDFLSCLNSNFLPIPANFHLTYFLYPDARTLNEEGCATTPKETIGGRHNETRNEVFTYESCGIGIVSHELMHKIVRENFKEIEPWASEGIPTFFENIYGYKSSVGPVFYVGYQSPWRIKELGEQLNTLTIQSIVDPAASINPYQESDKRVLATFLFNQGKLRDYFKLAIKGEHPGYKTILEAAFQEKITSLEPRFRQFVDTIGANRRDLLSLPDSQYFQSQIDFERFMQEHREAFAARPLPALTKLKLVGKISL